MRTKPEPPERLCTMTAAALLLRCIVVVAPLLLVGCSDSEPQAPESCQLPEAGAPSADAYVRWQQDLDYTVEALARCHKSPFTKISEAAFREEASALRSRFEQLDDDQSAVALGQLVARIGDAHTRLGLSPNALGFELLPVGLYWFSEGLHVTSATAEHVDLRGLRVTHVDSTTADKAHVEAATLVPHENDTWLLAATPGLLVMAEVLAALELAPDPTSVTLHFEDAQGSASERALEPLRPFVRSLEEGDLTTAPLYRHHPELSYWYAHLPDEQLLYLQYNRAKDDPQQPFSDFVVEAMAVVDKESVSRLVVDLRNNGGGSSLHVDPLLAALDARPEVNQQDRLFVIIGRRTFSAAVFNALHFQQSTNATLVGEPSGGKPNHFGEIETFVLPTSGLTVSYSTKYFTLVDGEPESVFPDIAVDFTAAAFFADEDPAMSVILGR